jgi:glycosyltransferase involved in cell wall biosynthesis
VASVLIENAPGSTDMEAGGMPERLRAELGIGASEPVVLYTGTFEAYQGLDLLMAAVKHVLTHRPDVRLVLAGGQPQQIEAARAEAARLGIADAVVFAGQRPAPEIPLFLRMADVLVSPRSTGTNTPLKIYQYLRSGTAIVATRLLTHTQVLNDDVAVLTPPTPEGFAEGILRVIDHPGTASLIAERARHLAETKYSYDVYLARTREACEHLFGPPAAAAAGGLA